MKVQLQLQQNPQDWSHGEKLGLGMIWQPESLKRAQERLLVQLCSGAGLSLCPVGGRVGDEELSTPFEAQRMRSGPQVSNTELFTPLNLKHFWD